MLNEMDEVLTTFFLCVGNILNHEFELRNYR
jgi:hypothetical protein